MPAPLHTTLVPRTALMRFHDPERIQGYCAACEKYGHTWSCPPFSEPPLLSFPAWSFAVIVCGRVPVPPEAAKESMIALFFEARKLFRQALVEQQQREIGVTALIAGFCSGCESCSRPEGKPCRTPAALRYSLEAVGFDVTALAENLAGQKLHWPKQGNPEYLMTVGALLCPNEAVAARLATVLGAREVSAP